jgi:hypothetical protein
LKEWLQCTKMNQAVAINPTFCGAACGLWVKNQNHAATRPDHTATDATPLTPVPPMVVSLACWCMGHQLPQSEKSESDGGCVVTTRSKVDPL